MTDDPGHGGTPQHRTNSRVLATDDKSDEEVDTERWAQLASHVLDAEGVPNGEMGLLFVSEDEMARLNAVHMDGSGPTDVLSFPIDEVPGSDKRAATGASTPNEAELMVGDVVICPLVAKANAAAEGRGTDDEVALLVVHGVLHLLGMDHAEPDEAARMQALERDYLDRFHR